MGKKKGADVGLATEQYGSLDREFYNSYPKEYFLCKLSEILLKISSPEEVMSALNGKKVNIGKLSATFQEDDCAQVVRYAKMELYETYIHCMESFFRLFVARASLSGCDWLAMAKLSTTSYREILSRIVSDNHAEINQSLNWNQTVQYAFTGNADNGAVECDVIENWKSWISFCAHELFEVKAYNSYKHGLTLRAYEGGFSMVPEGENSEFGRHGDVISYLTKNEKADRFVWVKKTEFLDIDYIGYKTYVFGQLINSMITTGQYQHGKTDVTERWYPAHELTPFLSREEIGTDIQSIFKLVSSFTLELVYYADSQIS